MMYKIDETILTKKPHVCGSNSWTVMRIGIEIKIKCNGCGREIMLLKIELDKKVIKKLQT